MAITQNYSNIPNDYIASWDLDWSWEDKTWTYDLTRANITDIPSEKWYTAETSSFNGSSSYATNSTFLDSWLTAWSVSFWFRYTWTGWAQVLFEKYWPWTDPYQISILWNFFWNNGRLWLSWSGWILWQNTYWHDWWYNDWEWYHCVVYWDNSWRSSVKMYVNAQLVWALDSTTWWNTWSISARSTYDAYIWRRSSWTSNWLNWSVVLMKWYNRVLSQAEINNLYAEWIRYIWSRASYANLLQDCVAYLDMRGDAIDCIGWYNGTVSWASLTTDHLWKSNHAYDFDWSNDYINLWTWDIWIGWSFTLSCWVNPDTLSWYDNIFSDWSTWKVNFFLQASANDWILMAASWDWWSNWDGTYLRYTLSTSTWQHIVYTRSWTTKTLYINWVQQDTFTWWYSWWVTTNNKVFWSWSVVLWTNVYDWKLGYPILIERALSASEVLTLYNLTSKKYIYPYTREMTPNLMNGLQVWIWDSSWNDYSWNGNNGTPTNITKVRRNQSEWWDYNGSSSRIDLWTSATLFDLSTYTYSIWIKRDTHSATARIVWYGWINQTYWFKFISSFTDWTIGFQNWTAPVYSPVLTDWEWYHLAMTCNWSTVEWYVNWVSIWTASYWTSAMADPTTPHLYLWCWRKADVLFFNWKSIDFKYRNRALSAFEVQQEYMLNFLKFN